MPPHRTRRTTCSLRRPGTGPGCTRCTTGCPRWSCKIRASRRRSCWRRRQCTCLHRSSHKPWTQPPPWPETPSPPRSRRTMLARTQPDTDQKRTASRRQRPRPHKTRARRRHRSLTRSPRWRRMKCPRGSSSTWTPRTGSRTGPRRRACTLWRWRCPRLRSSSRACSSSSSRRRWCYAKGQHYS